MANRRHCLCLHRSFSGEICSPSTVLQRSSKIELFLGSDSVDIDLSKPSPEHSFLLGNLKVMGEWTKKYPPDMHPQPLLADLRNEYKYRGLYYLDLYPFAESLLVITDVEVASQVQTSPGFHRHPFVKKYLRGLVGTKSIFVTQGAEWQRQRSWFNPAFSLNHLLTLVPGIVEEGLVFKEKLTEFAVSGEVISMNDAAMKLTIDVIARSVGDIRLKSQTEFSEIQNHFVKATEWTAEMSAPLWHHILSPFMMYYHTRKLDMMLGKIIKEKYKRTREDGIDKSILDLALKGYVKDTGRLEALKLGGENLDKDFMQVALDKYAFNSQIPSFKRSADEIRIVPKCSCLVVMIPQHQ